METIYQYFRRIFVHRSKQFFSILALISFIIFISYSPEFIYGVGPIFQKNDERYGDVWFIDRNGNNNLDYRDLIIANSELYDFLTPQNEGAEVVYFWIFNYPLLAELAPLYVNFLYLEIIYVYNWRVACIKLLLTAYLILFVLFFIIKRSNYQFIHKILI